jgi:hypothetical protein
MKRDKDKEFNENRAILDCIGWKDRILYGSNGYGITVIDPNNIGKKDEYNANQCARGFEPLGESILYMALNGSDAQAKQSLFILDPETGKSRELMQSNADIGYSTLGIYVAYAASDMEDRADSDEIRIMNPFNKATSTILTTGGLIGKILSVKREFFGGLLE